MSIIIPTRNRRVLLQATLATLAEQTVDPATFEVIVVADGPTDDTPAELAALAATTNWAGRLHPLVQSWAGAAAARNRGLSAARGRWVLFLDDDVQAAPGLIAAHIARHTGGPPAGQVVLGHIVPHSLAGALHQQLTLWWTDHYRRLADGARWNALYTGNVSVPAEAARRAGGFDAAIAYGEDVAFGYALHEQGLP
ncbi:MAG TPA: glycosyltransferase family 2 protein, partial [Chloroflexia bacterium]|nr:glycosyltransferase family 2 protein [Chloroflexia bacterium]